MTGITAQDIERAVARHLDHGPDDEIVGMVAISAGCPIANACNAHLSHGDNEHFEACQRHVGLYVSHGILPHVTVDTTERLRDFVDAVDLSSDTFAPLTRKAARDIWLSLERSDA